MNLLSTLSQAGRSSMAAASTPTCRPIACSLHPASKITWMPAAIYTWTYGTTPTPYFELKNTVNANVIRLDVGSNALNPSLGYEFISVSSANTLTAGQLIQRFHFHGNTHRSF